MVKRKFVVTTTIGKKSFKAVFSTVAGVDKYLAGAKAYHKQYPKAKDAKIRIQTKEVGKKLTKGIVKIV